MSNNPKDRIENVFNIIKVEDKDIDVKVYNKGEDLEFLETSNMGGGKSVASDDVRVTTKKGGTSQPTSQGNPQGKPKAKPIIDPDGEGGDENPNGEDENPEGEDGNPEGEDENPNGEDGNPEGEDENPEDEDKPRKLKVGDKVIVKATNKIKRVTKVNDNGTIETEDVDITKMVDGGLSNNDANDNDGNTYRDDEVEIFQEPKDSKGKKGKDKSKTPPKNPPSPPKNPPPPPPPPRDPDEDRPPLEPPPRDEEIPYDEYNELRRRLNQLKNYEWLIRKTIDTFLNTRNIIISNVVNGIMYCILKSFRERPNINNYEEFEEIYNDIYRLVGFVSSSINLETYRYDEFRLWKDNAPLNLTIDEIILNLETYDRETLRKIINEVNKADENKKNDIQTSKILAYGLIAYPELFDIEESYKIQLKQLFYFMDSDIVISGFNYYIFDIDSTIEKTFVEVPVRYKHFLLSVNIFLNKGDIKMIDFTPLMNYSELEQRKNEKLKITFVDNYFSDENWDLRYKVNDFIGYFYQKYLPNMHKKEYIDLFNEKMKYLINLQQNSISSYLRDMSIMTLEYAV